MQWPVSPFHYYLWPNNNTTLCLSVHQLVNRQVVSAFGILRIIMGGLLLGVEQLGQMVILHFAF